MTERWVKGTSIYGEEKWFNMARAHVVVKVPQFDPSGNEHWMWKEGHRCAVDNYHVIEPPEHFIEPAPLSVAGSLVGGIPVGAGDGDTKC